MSDAPIDDAPSEADRLRARLRTVVRWINEGYLVVNESSIAGKHTDYKRACAAVGGFKLVAGAWLSGAMKDVEEGGGP